MDFHVIHRLQLSRAVVGIGVALQYQCTVYVYDQLIQWNKSQDGFPFNLLLLIMAAFFFVVPFFRPFSHSQCGSSFFCVRNMTSKIIHYISEENKGSIK